MKQYATLIRVDSRTNPDAVEYSVTVPENGNHIGREVGLIRLDDAAANIWMATTPDGDDVGRFEHVTDAVRTLIALQ